MTEEIPFDASPHVWLNHKGLKPGDEAGTDWVQILSLQADGAWVRFVQRPEMAKWKVYFPRDRIITMFMEDDAWPTS